MTVYKMYKMYELTRMLSSYTVKLYLVEYRNKKTSCNLKGKPI